MNSFHTAGCRIAYQASGFINDISRLTGYPSFSFFTRRTFLSPTVLATAQVLAERVGQDVAASLLVLDPEASQLGHLVLVLLQALKKGAASSARHKDHRGCCLQLRLSSSLLESSLLLGYPTTWC